MTDRPDDLIREARAEAQYLADGSDNLDPIGGLLARLADALEAAQKEKDWWFQRSMGAESEATFEQSQSDGLRARVRQLEEALNGTVGALGLWEGATGEINVWPPACRKALATAREVLAAKENTTP